MKREITSDVEMGFDSGQIKRHRPKRKEPSRSKVKKILTTGDVDTLGVPHVPKKEFPQPRNLQPNIPPKKTHVEIPSLSSTKTDVVMPQPTEVEFWIVVPTRNRPVEFKKCIGGLLEQLEPRDRIVAVATGDEMFDIVRGVAEHPQVLGLLIGQASVNTARRTANGLIPENAVIIETGDNDYIRPNSLKRIRKAFEDPDAGVVYGNLQFIRKDGRPYGPITRKPVWAKGVMHKRCEIRGLHAYRKTIYSTYGGWYEEELPAGDHANAIRWEDAGVKFVSLGSQPLVNCVWDPAGMSVARRHDQHMNSQAFARGEYKRNISVGFACWSMAGRRTKMLALVDKICNPENVKLYACGKSRYSQAMDLDPDIQRRVVLWRTVDDLNEWLPNHQVPHLFIDRLCFAADLVKRGRRVVVDVCDLRTQRQGAATDDEDERILCTSPNVWLMFVSEGHRDYICERYDVPVERTRIVTNLPMRAWQPKTPLAIEDKVPNSLVYYGGIGTRKNQTYSYRYYYNLFKLFKDAGIEVHIYPSCGRPTEMKALYSEFHIHERFEHRNIYDTLRRYSVGFAGYEDRAGCPEISHNYAMSCYPNKATDYMMAGIPTLSYALGLSEKDVKNWGICIPKGDAHRLVAAYYEAIEKQIDFQRWQSEFCMESQAPKILAAYDWVMEQQKR